MGFQSQLKKDQHHFIIQLIKTTLPILSTPVVQATIPKPKGEQCVQVSPQYAYMYIIKSDIN